MKPFTTLFVLLVLAVGGYFGYRYMQLSNVPKTLSLDAAERFQDIPPTVCTLSDERSIVTGDLYISNDIARIDIKAPGAQYHIVVNSEGTGFFWKEGETTGLKGDYAAIAGHVGLAVLTKVDCKPLWLPAGDIFIAPDTVKFNLL